MPSEVGHQRADLLSPAIVGLLSLAQGARQAKSGVERPSYISKFREARKNRKPLREEAALPMIFHAGTLIGEP